jgi:hypothetical protein
MKISEIFLNRIPTKYVEGFMKFSPPMMSAPYRGGGFEYSRDSESYAGSSVATDKSTHAGQVKG